MGLAIGIARDGPPWPASIVVTLACDNGHGLFAHIERFDELSVIYRAGWKEVHMKDGRKQWHGPCCSGKKRAN